MEQLAGTSVKVGTIRQGYWTFRDRLFLRRRALIL
jgi:hypothetical protein